MIKSLIGLSLFLGMPSLALGESEFERGYNAGLASCSRAPLTECEIKVKFRYTYFYGYGAGPTSGAAKAAALRDCQANFSYQPKEVQERATSEGESCLLAVELGYIKCT